MMRWRWPLLLAGLAVGLSAGPALAHIGLVLAEPAPGSRLTTAPQELRLAFDAALLPGSTLWLYAGAFERVPGVEPVIDNTRLVAALPAALAPGTYTVQWSAVGDDGHTTEGSYGFAVMASRPALWPAVWLAGAVIAGLGVLAARRKR